MKTKIQIKSISGKLLFEDECENNSIKKTVEKAILVNADIRYADLRNADLRYANIRGNLRGVDFSGANLRGADLSGAKNKEIAYLPIYCKWSHSIIGDKIQIGCQEKTIEEWENFFNSDEIISTERNTSEFKQIQAVFEAYKGYLNFLNK
jgi:hypothetical protein